MLKQQLCLLNQLSLNIAKKKTFFNFFLNKNHVQFLYFLEKIGLIRNFFFLNKNFCRIFPFYTRNYRGKKKWRLFFRKNEKLYLSLKMLKTLKFLTPTTLFVLSTNKNILTHHNAIQKKISGKLLMIVL